MKKSFILHHDTISVIEELSNEDAGKLIKAIYRYSVALNNNPDEPKKPSGLSGLLDCVFHPFKMQLIRDLDKYQKIVERNQINGKFGGRPKKKKPRITQRNPKKPDNDNDKVNDSDNEKENDFKSKKIFFSEFVKMTEEEHNRLVGEFGRDFTDECIKELDNYIPNKPGKPYKDHNRAIRSWVVDKVKKRKAGVTNKEEIARRFLERHSRNGSPF